MKKILFFVFSFSFLLCFVGCDKIEEDQYWVYAGANGTWYDTDEEVPVVQRAFVEKYTGVRCVNCPKADGVLHDALEKYGEQLVVVAVHSGAFGNPFQNEEDLRTEGGNAWFSFFGINSQPAALLMRAKNGAAWDIFTPTSNFDDKIDAVLSPTPKVAIKVVPVNEEGKTVGADIYLSFEETVTDSLTVTLLLTEDKIYTTQESYTKSKIENYEQNHVLRGIITDPWGADVVASGTAGEKRTVRLPFEMNGKWKAADCHLVAFVSDKATRRILNVAETSL